MKLPKSSRAAIRELERVVQKALKALDNEDSSHRKNVEKMINVVILQVAKNRGLDVDSVAELTSEVLESLPEEYKLLPEDLQSAETLISLLYMKYHVLLGIDLDAFQKATRE